MKMKADFIISLVIIFSTTALCDITAIFGNDFKKQVNEIVPPEVKKFYGDLSATDKNIFSDIIGRLNEFSNSTDLLNALEGKSKFLYQKAENLIGWYHDAYGNLSGNAKNFVSEAVETGKRIIGGGVDIKNIRYELNGLVNNYRKLPDYVKGELDNNFPKLAAVVHNDILKTIAQSLFGIGMDNLDLPRSNNDNPTNTDDVVRPSSNPSVVPSDDNNSSGFNTTPVPDNSGHKIPGDDIEEEVIKKAVDLKRYNRF
uniref:DUF148 domain-containing protein n=1 Tax=Parastrongyloides trichosuri TaxID=131310 RepID=A0A0N4ZKE8_PARTI